MTTATPAEADPRAVLRDRLAEMREAIVAEMVRDGFSAVAGPDIHFIAGFPLFLLCAAKWIAPR